MDDRSRPPHRINAPYTGQSNATFVGERFNQLRRHPCIAGGPACSRRGDDPPASLCVKMDRAWRPSAHPPTADASYANDSRCSWAGSSLGRRLLAEFLGTTLLHVAVVGSGIAAQTLSPSDDRHAGRRPIHQRAARCRYRRRRLIQRASRGSSTGRSTTRMISAQNTRCGRSGSSLRSISSARSDSYRQQSVPGMSVS
jgi:hypothetical protein